MYTGTSSLCPETSTKLFLFLRQPWPTVAFIFNHHQRNCTFMNSVSGPISPNLLVFSTIPSKCWIAPANLSCKSQTSRTVLKFKSIHFSYISHWFEQVSLFNFDNWPVWIQYSSVVGHCVVLPIKPLSLPLFILAKLCWSVRENNFLKLFNRMPSYFFLQYCAMQRPQNIGTALFWFKLVLNEHIYI